MSTATGTRTGSGRTFVLINSTRKPVGGGPDAPATRAWTPSEAPTQSGSVAPRASPGALPSDSRACQPVHCPVTCDRVRTCTVPPISAAGSSQVTPSMLNGAVASAGIPAGTERLTNAGAGAAGELVMTAAAAMVNAAATTPDIPRFPGTTTPVVPMVSSGATLPRRPSPVPEMHNFLVFRTFRLRRIAGKEGVDRVDSRAEWSRRTAPCQPMSER